MLLCCGSKVVDMIVLNFPKEEVSLGSRKGSSIGHLEAQCQHSHSIAFGGMYFYLSGPQFALRNDLRFLLTAPSSLSTEYS